VPEHTARGGNGSGRADPARDPAAENGQRYESFIVRILLNDDGSIRDTRMEHIGTGQVKRWAGWAHDAMLDFVREIAGQETAAAPAPPAAAGLLAAPLGPPDAPLHAEPVPEPAGPVPPDAPAPSALAPVLALRPDRTVVRAGQPFTLTLSLELTEAAQRGQRLAYSAVIVARPFGGRARSTLAIARGLLATEDTATITVAANGPPPGIYLMDGAVSLRAAGASHGEVAAMAEGIMLHVLPP
jgi:hypothetical protein